MRQLLLAASVLTFVAACSDPEVVVTRKQFGDDWPLEVNSATVECADEGATPLLKIGVNRYALNEAALAKGYPDALEVAREGAPHPRVLASACTAQIASNS